MTLGPEAWAAIIGGMGGSILTGLISAGITWLTLRDARKAREHEASERRRDRREALQTRTLVALRDALPRLYKMASIAALADKRAKNGRIDHDDFVATLANHAMAKSRVIGLAASIEDNEARVLSCEAAILSHAAVHGFKIVDEAVPCPAKQPKRDAFFELSQKIIEATQRIGELIQAEH